MGALEAYSWEWGSALIRWLHVTAAIAWIGGSGDTYVSHRGFGVVGC